MHSVLLHCLPNCFIGGTIMALHFPEGCPKTVLLPESFAPSAAVAVLMRHSPVFINQRKQYITEKAAVSTNIAFSPLRWYTFYIEAIVINKQQGETDEQQQSEKFFRQL